MNNTSNHLAIACLAIAALGFASTSQAQCMTCPTPQMVFSPVVQPVMQPVVINTYDDGWYLGKYIGRMGRRIFGTAPAPATQVAFAMPAPQTTFAAYAPACTTCGTSPCCCAQTTFRPVIMQPATTCTTCYAPACTTCNACGTCDACSGVTQASFDAPMASSCPTCNTSSYVQSTDSAAPSLPSNSPAPPQTFRETDRLDPVPAEESRVEDSNADWNAPMLLDPNDKITKRPTAPVWTAVYKKPAKITSVRTADRPATQPKPTIGWTSGR